MASQTAPASIRSGWHLETDAGYLRLEGVTRRDFLQRQTTNDVNLLKPERSLLTVLTGPTARILDVFVLLDEGDGIGILTLPGNGERTARFLRSRIFFNDHVALSDAGAAAVQFDVFGPEAEAALSLAAAAGPEFRDAGTGMVEVNRVIELGGGVRVVRMEPSFGLGYRWIAPREAFARIEPRLRQAGLTQVSSDDYASLRVEAGLPSANRELTEEYTPLEAGLRAAVSDHKGCYTGQEIIARQITYDKVTRLLCGLQLSGPAEQGSELSAPDGTPAGRLTSTVESPRFGWIGLGIVRRPYHQLGTALRAGAVDTGGAVVVGLPFTNA